MNRRGTPLRDELVGAAVRGLDVPEHRPEFFAELRDELAGQHIDFPREQALGLRLQRARVRWLAGLAAATVLVAAVFVAVRLPRSSVASAAEVRRTVVQTLASVDTLTGSLVRRGYDSSLDRYVEDRWTFVVTSRGDFRLTSAKYGTDLAHDADANVETYADEYGLVLSRGVPVAWPDGTAPDWILNRALGSVLGGLAEEGDSRVEEVEYGGRPAWLLRLEAESGRDDPAIDERRVTVDRATGIPVRDAVLNEGRLVEEWRIDDLRVDPELGPDALSVPERGQKLVRRDEGFRRVGLDTVDDAVGYAPLVPTWLPSGFRLAEVMIAEEAPPTGSGPDENPSSRSVATLVYRRGLHLVAVSTRLTGRDALRWSDPVPAGGPGVTAEPREITFEAGALRGRRGRLVLDLETVPHLWVVTDRLVVTVAGYLRPYELMRIANSLEPRA